MEKWRWKQGTWSDLLFAIGFPLFLTWAYNHAPKKFRRLRRYLILILASHSVSHCCAIAATTRSTLRNHNKSNRSLTNLSNQLCYNCYIVSYCILGILQLTGIGHHLLFLLDFGNLNCRLYFYFLPFSIGREDEQVLKLQESETNRMMASDFPAICETFDLIFSSWIVKWHFYFSLGNRVKFPANATHLLSSQFPSSCYSPALLYRHVVNAMSNKQ